MTNSVAIPHERDGSEAVGFGSYRILETFGDRASPGVVDDVDVKFERALQDFPELISETVSIGYLDQDDVEDGTKGRAWFNNRLIFLPAKQWTSFITVYHELGHLGIAVRDDRGEDVPKTSEEFCSIFAMTRMPVELIDEHRIPYLGEPSVPKEEWPEICEDALEYREERGANSHYIQRCKEWLEVKS